MELNCMKNIQLPILFTALASLFSFSAVAQNIIVDGAGSSQVNGLYEETGTYNGKPRYVFQNGGDTYALVWTCNAVCSNWHIFRDNCYPDNCFMGAYYYTNAPESNLPPSSGWNASSGDSPVPTVMVNGPALTYSTLVFREGATDNGTMGNTITITYNGYGGDTFTGTNGDDLVADGKATVTNLPAGLEASLVRSSATSLTFSLTLAAIDHANVDDISNFTIEFADNAFTGGNAAGVNGYVKNNIAVDFIQVLTVATSGADFATIAAAIAAAAPNDIIVLAAETFTESGIPIDKPLTIKGQGAAQTIVQAHAAYNTASTGVFGIPYGSESVTISDLTIQHGKNTGGWGAGISHSSPLRLERCVIQKNIVIGAFNTFGGGIHSSGASLTAVDCLFLENVTQPTAGGMSKGGAVYHDNSSGYYTNCTFSANGAMVSGDGGGIHQNGGDILAVSNCTFTGNTAGASGAAVFNFFGGEQHFTNTIMYGNTAPERPDYAQIGGNSNARNCITEHVIVFDGSSNISNADPLLGALADNGGPTMTYAIGVGSPAIDAGLDGVTDFDQRGNYRNGTRDIGAFEYNAFPVWTGLVSDEWEVPGNWSTGQVPDQYMDAVVTADAVTDPVVYSGIGAPALCRDLHLDAGASLIIIPAGAMTIAGDLTNDGVISILAEDYGIGSLITQGTVTGSGTFQAQQYLLGAGDATPNGVFQYVSSSVVGATSATYSAAGTDKLWSANEVTQDYTDIEDNITLLNGGEGYVARVGANGTVTAQGTAFHTGDVDIENLTRSAGPNVNNRGYNLIGNPYPSSVNWSNATKTNVETTLWYRTHTAGNVMIAETYNATLGEGTNNGNYTGQAAAGIIPPGQAFWVRVVDGETEGSVSFTNTMRSHGSQASIYKQEAAEGTVRLHLSNGTLSDETIVHFTTDAEDSYDDFDSQKMWMNTLPQLYTTVSTDSLTINGLFSIETNPIVDLGIKTPTAGDYTITASSITLTEEVWLEDKLLNNFQHLNMNPVYAFTTNSGNIGNRFALHFGEMAVVGVEENGSATHVFAADGVVNVSVGRDITAGMITILDMAGRTVQTAAITGSRTVVPTDLITGIYLVRVETEKGAETHRVLLR